MNMISIKNRINFKLKILIFPLDFIKSMLSRFQCIQTVILVALAEFHADAMHYFVSVAIKDNQ